MVFLLSPNLATVIATSPSNDLINALQHLADSRRCGQNEILGDREVFRTISKCLALSYSARAVYHRLAEASSTMRNLLTHCVFYVFVTEEPSVRRRERDGDRERIIISIEYLARTQSLSQRPVLLCENLDDCDFIISLAAFYNQFKKLYGYINFSKRNGGGSTTAPCYEDIVSHREELCLCLCDSDKKYEGDMHEGDTATALREVETRHDTTLTHLYVLQCQEAENLIPASILADVYATDPQKLDAVSDLKRIQSERIYQLWRYYDVKNGIRVFEFATSANSAYQNSWARVFGSVTDSVSRYCETCSAAMVCTTKAECTTYLVRGFGSTALRDTVNDFLTTKPMAEIVRRLSPPILTEWESIGALVWSWGTVGGCIVS